MNKRDPNKEKQMRRFEITQEQKDKIEPRVEIELWANVVFRGLETNYLVSTLGRVKRKKRREKNHPLYVTPYINRDGYIQVQLRINKKYYLVTVHRLVMMAFCKVPKRYRKLGYTSSTLEINHKNGLKYDNYLGNLEWCTSSENIIHAFKQNLRKPLKRPTNITHVNHLKSATVHEICKELENNKTIESISKKYNTTRTSISLIKNHHTWKNISALYNF